MADHDLRDLERSSQTDPAASARLARERWRAGRCPGCGQQVAAWTTCCCFLCWSPAAASARCRDCPRWEETP